MKSGGILYTIIIIKDNCPCIVTCPLFYIVSSPSLTPDTHVLVLSSLFMDDHDDVDDMMMMVNGVLPCDANYLPIPTTGFGLGWGGE